jgi:uncharacterized membrane protein YidH (DUF202 family)
MKLFKSFFDWVFITNYNYTVLKQNNPEFMSIKFTSFIFCEFAIFFINVFSLIFKIKPMKPYWFIIIYLIIFGINYFYYFTLNNKNNIKIIHRKNDMLFVNLLFFLSALLCFYTYCLVVGN